MWLLSEFDTLSVKLFLFTTDLFLEIIISWPRSGEFSKLSKLSELLDAFPFKDDDVASKEEILTILTDVCLCLENEHDFKEYIEVISE